MRPWVVAAALATLMTITSTCYFFQIPDDLKSKETQRVGRWGPPNAEFNWCEADFEYADWLAEPINTLSCLAMIILPVGFVATHKATSDVVLVSCLEVAIAIGSMLFHASLRYTMQLADEIPMLWYVAALACSCLLRVKGLNASLPVLVWVIAVSLGVLTTEQHSSRHEFFRGCMTVSFCVCLVLTGWGVTAIVQRLKEDVAEKQRKAAFTAEKILEVGLIMFLASVFAWLLDNYCCGLLQNLPGGLPYPQLHTWWHVLVAGALHCVTVLLQVDSKRDSECLDVRFAYGVLPVVKG
eukprot:TRINITY_DN36977_c0_g1_i1.p1 TRINITY_DN36977_c0_g1~~TRINITY_DN36977_c0_g1_i1.p1  ORF type:complete len:296 (+),score=60.13 TRINITY_DN36977_c0_g1_i1:50-937(+)